MIALGCAISFGVPALILAYLTWRKRSRIIARAYVHGQNADDQPPAYELHGFVSTGGRFSDLAATGKERLPEKEGSYDDRTHYDL